MKRILTSKAGVTLLEGVIALGLLALITGGAFAVLLAASRQATQPDIREEMSLAVEKAHEQLKILAMYGDQSDVNNVADLSKTSLPSRFYSNGQAGLCDKEDNPLSTTKSHNIACLLPPICDANTSSFTYQVENSTALESAGSSETGGTPAPYKITFSITCNGYSL